jgi:hypothetical protein
LQLCAVEIAVVFPKIDTLTFPLMEGGQDESSVCTVRSISVASVQVVSAPVGAPSRPESLFDEGEEPLCQCVPEFVFKPQFLLFIFAMCTAIQSMLATGESSSCGVVVSCAVGMCF